MINLVHAGKVFEFLTRQYIFKVCFIYVEKMINTVAEGTGKKKKSSALKNLGWKLRKSAALLCSGLG